MLVSELDVKAPDDTVGSVTQVTDGNMVWLLRYVAAGILAFMSLVSCQMLAGLDDRRTTSGASAGQAGTAGGENANGEGGADGEEGGTTPGHSGSDGQASGGRVRATGGGHGGMAGEANELGAAATGGKAAGGSEAGGASTGGDRAGGTETGGAATGGEVSTGGTGGVDAGGRAIGGESTAGRVTGGATGSESTGGIGTGGIGTGGTSTGGVAAGGVSTGGVSTGGVTTGGATGTCPGADESGAVNIDSTIEYQTIRGFGGANIPAWTGDLTSSQIQTAFGNGAGELGLTILRMQVPSDPGEFSNELPTPQAAQALGAIVIASPWTPPAHMKTGGTEVGGELDGDSYAAYADHLSSFIDFMKSNGVTPYAVSVQNEPDYEAGSLSCLWSSSQFITWLTDQGSRFRDTKLMVAESVNFNRTLTDPILNDDAAAAQVDIIAGHIYGGGLSDYALARDKGKEVWMTEHYTDSTNDANAWPVALNVGKELHDCMVANFSAYVWWYIRRSYGPITEDGVPSKRGWLMAQYSKFVRPGHKRIRASVPSASNVFVTAYSRDSQVVVVAVNMNSVSSPITLNVRNTCVASFTKYTTSGSKSLRNDGSVTLTNNSASVTLDAQSTTTFVSE
jgi:O-glycosyl hydrolase